LLNEGYQKKYIFGAMGRLWRALKSRIVQRIMKCSNQEERMKLKPTNIKSKEDWKAFIKKKTCPEFLVRVVNFYLFTKFNLFRYIKLISNETCFRPKVRGLEV
jgi:hypothetical protein